MANRTDADIIAGIAEMMGWEEIRDDAGFLVAWETAGNESEVDLYVGWEDFDPISSGDDWLAVLEALPEGITVRMTKAPSGYWAWYFADHPGNLSSNAGSEDDADSARRATLESILSHLEQQEQT